ncbi:B3/4 domain-containing protein [Streptococcus pseudoporcinus]|uniref:B3/4 domain-containing protein n=1 Tax=Streptococcus pseudoporcinus TaxID=361101 RepID=A0A4U9XKB0_9STRE|nr:B3/4 domain-containing protein [Streptococcus pseudoporcinus]VTS12711.1 B3/4 domain-containing protein [Streptococcus pseudoporcinus]VUC65423.1 B3/4 domain-containing protein [Streptococcus pseudoporcinus]VUC96320.1 B3/4 domain-containing protein [Streptococcus pseudoporcinus]VUC96714.1 B3/4 domain-containing protein [Streptococcus pseudoporcinus]
MSRFIVDQSFWDLFPEAQLGVVLLHNYQSSGESSKEIKMILRESQSLAEQYLTESNFADNEVIRTYRNAYQQFKTKKGARSSIEALLKRVSKGNQIPSINPLVDIYNAASLRFALPVGAEDLDSFVGDLRLTITDGNDSFYLIGDENNSPTLPNELCYKDDIGAVCRCLNWRDGARTMITANTKNAFLVIELLDRGRLDQLIEALNFIEDHAKLQLGAEVEKYILTKENTFVDLGKKI